MVFLYRGDGSDAIRKRRFEAKEIPTAKIQWSVASDVWLADALNQLWSPYRTLLVQIDVEADKAETTAPIDLDAWRERLTKLNPDAAAAAIEAEARMLSRVDLKRYERISPAFVARIMTLYTQVTLLSAALCEAKINLALEWACAVARKAELFDLVERSTPVEKWQHGPKIFVADYELPPGAAESETLIRVFSERNRLMHAKALVEVDGNANARPQKYKVRDLPGALTWLPRYFSLPFDLSDILENCSVNGHGFPRLFRRQEIERVPQHKLTRDLLRHRAKADR